MEYMQNESMSLPLAYANRMPNVTLRRPPLLVLLHGIGSNEHEFLKFAQSFDERLAILSVRAPFAQTAGSFLWFNL